MGHWGDICFPQKPQVQGLALAYDWLKCHNFIFINFGITTCAQNLKIYLKVDKVEADDQKGGWALGYLVNIKTLVMSMRVINSTILREVGCPHRMAV